MLQLARMLSLNFDVVVSRDTELHATSGAEDEGHLVIDLAGDFEYPKVCASYCPTVGGEVVRLKMPEV